MANSKSAVDHLFSELQRMEYYIGNDIYAAYIEAKEMYHKQSMESWDAGYQAGKKTRDQKISDPVYDAKHYADLKFKNIIKCEHCKSEVDLDQTDTCDHCDVSIFDGTKEKMYSESRVEELLDIQRGNCYVAVLTKCRDYETAVECIECPEPWNWKNRPRGI
jgi:hypothetical protein